MRRKLAVVLFAILSAILVAAQQPTPPPTAEAQSATQTVYYAGPGVTAPELLPIPFTAAVTEPCKKYDVTAKLSAVVDQSGAPHDVFFLRPIGNDLDKMAINLVTTDQFKPGSYDGAPAAVAVSIAVNLPTCFVKVKDEAGNEVGQVRLRSLPIQKVDIQPPPPSAAMTTLNVSAPLSGGITPPEVFHPGPGNNAPVLLNRVETEYSDYGRRQRISGSCLISLVVDEHGMPHDLRVIRSLEPSLDQNALNGVSQYRFKPAMRNGSPVPVRITVEVDFHLFSNPSPQ